MHTCKHKVQSNVFPERKNYCCASRIHPLSGKCFRVCSPFSLWLNPLCISGCKVASSVLLNRSHVHLRVYLQFSRIYFQISFIFSSELCIFFPFDVYLFFSGCGDFSHNFKQTHRTILGFALVPFSSFYTEYHLLILNFQSTLLGYLAATSLCTSGHWRKFMSQIRLKMKMAREFPPTSATKAHKKSWSICMSIFYSHISWHNQVAKAQNLQHELVLSHFLPFSLRCHALMGIVQAVFSSSWRVLLKK